MHAKRSYFYDIVCRVADSEGVERTETVLTLDPDEDTAKSGIGNSVWPLRLLEIVAVHHVPDHEGMKRLAENERSRRNVLEGA